MEHRKILDILRHGHPDETVIVRGWIRTKRDLKNFSFIELNDGSALANLQIVLDPEVAGPELLKHLNTGASVEVQGALVESPAKGQRLELQAQNIHLYGGVDSETYPLQKKRHSFEFLRTIAHLRSRTNTLGAVFRVRNSAANAVHQFFQERGFLWIHTPILTSSDCEGAGELFNVTQLDLANIPKTEKQAVDYQQDFFGKPAYLTVSGQLEAEVMAMAFSNVYTFGPTFRAENSNTARHLAEFWMIEPEVAFADLEDLAQLSEDFLKFVFARVLDRCGEDMAFFAERIEPEAVTRLEKLVSTEFVQMDYAEAIEILNNSSKKFEYKPEWGVDLQTEHERYLTEQHCKAPVVVKNYPDEIKAFYMRLNDDARTVAAMDVLAPGIGEIIGGSQREERLDVLKSRMDHHGLDAETYSWYVDLRRYGTVPHAGFGLGFERLLNYITGLGNIRDVIPYPRTPGSAPF